MGVVQGYCAVPPPSLTTPNHNPQIKCTCTFYCDTITVPLYIACIFPYRVLIFTQMARMLDVLEIFLTYHGHTYLRLDGATPVTKRQVSTLYCTTL